MSLSGGYSSGLLRSSEICAADLCTFVKRRFLAARFDEIASPFVVTTAVYIMCGTNTDDREPTHTFNAPRTKLTVAS